MSFSFDPALGSWRDHLRLALGDTTQGQHFLENETYDAKLAAFGYSEALAQCAEALVSRFSQEPDRYAEGGSGLDLTWSSRLDGWKRLIESCRSGKTLEPHSGASVGSESVIVGELVNPERKEMRSD